MSLNAGCARVTFLYRSRTGAAIFEYKSIEIFGLFTNPEKFRRRVLNRDDATATARRFQPNNFGENGIVNRWP
jgi:hypothetical protein